MNRKSPKQLLEQELNLAKFEKQQAEITLLETKLIFLEIKLRTWRSLAFFFGAMLVFLLMYVLVNIL